MASESSKGKRIQLVYGKVSFYLVLSCLVLSCLVLSCLVLSCLVLSCLVLSCQFAAILLVYCYFQCAVFLCAITDLNTQADIILNRRMTYQSIAV